MNTVMSLPSAIVIVLASDEDSSPYKRERILEQQKSNNTTPKAEVQHSKHTIANKLHSEPLFNHATLPTS
jgi:hypothetical protein